MNPWKQNKTWLFKYLKLPKQDILTQTMSSGKSEISLAPVEASTSNASDTCCSVSTLNSSAVTEEDTNCLRKTDAFKSNSVRDIFIKKQIKLKEKYFLKIVDYLVRLMINMHIGPAALDQQCYQHILSELFRIQKTVTSAELDPGKLGNVNERLQNVDKNIQDLHVKWSQHYIDTLNLVTQQCLELIKLFDYLKKHNKEQLTLENNVIEFLNYTLAKKKSLYKLNVIEHEHDIKSESIYKIDQITERIQLLHKRLNKPFSIDYGHVPKLFGDSAKNEMKRKENERKVALKNDAEIEAVISNESNVLNNRRRKNKENYVGRTDYIVGQPDGENSLKITLKEGNAVNEFFDFGKHEISRAKIENEVHTKHSFLKSLRRVFSKNIFITHGNIDNLSPLNIVDIRKRLQHKYTSLKTELVPQIQKRRQFKINNIDSLMLVIMIVLTSVL